MEKVTTHDNKTFVGFCFDPMVITVVGFDTKCGFFIMLLAVQTGFASPLSQVRFAHCKNE